VSLCLINYSVRQIFGSAEHLLRHRLQIRVSRKIMPRCLEDIWAPPKGRCEDPASAKSNGRPIVDLPHATT
jgi:hypothetical protein